jgi:hypothetical protein
MLLVLKPEGKRPLGRSTCILRWEDNIEINFKNYSSGSSGGVL